MHPRDMKLAVALGLAVLGAPLSAHAQSQTLGCVAGPTDLNRCTITGAPAAALAAVAAPVLVAGAAVSIAHELSHRTEERATDANVATPPAARNGKRPAPNLALVPEPPDPYRAKAGAKETRKKPNAAFQFNETATNVATVITGAAVAGAIIATIVQDSRGAAHK